MSDVPGGTTSTPLILSQIVSLLAHGLTISSDDEVWLDGLRMLAEPKLHRSLSMTSSIWMPLLQRSLSADRDPAVIIAGLKLLARVADLVEPMKPAFVKPFKALIQMEDEAVMGSAEFYMALGRLGLELEGKDGRVLGQGMIMPPAKPETTPQANGEHPLLVKILNQCMPVKTRDVRQAWTSTLLSGTGEANGAWMRAFFQATIEASAVPELVITTRLDSQVHEELFPSAFMHCYAQIEADTIFRDKVDDALVRVLSSPGTSKEVVQAILELLAYLDQQQISMPSKVMDAAMASVMSDFGDLNKPLPAVNLWFAEQEALRTMQMDRLGDLVEANIRIGPSGYDAAWSTLQWVRDDYDVSPDPMWITQLAHWNRALDAQQEADGGHVGTFGSFNSRMVCYHALGQFDKGYALAQALYEGLNDYERRETSHWATAAAWHMGDYEAMSDYLAFHPKGTSKSLYKAIIDVQSGNYAPAFQHISKAQTLAYDELQSKLSIGPQEGLKTLAKTEYLVELQEVIQYRSQPDQRQQILSNWRARFKRSHQDSSSWLRRLQIWGLACEPTTWELQLCYLDLAKLCESQGMHEAAQRIIKLITPEVTPPGCKVEYTQFRFLWKDAYDSKDYSAMSSVLSQLREHSATYLTHLGIEWDGIQQEGLGMQPVLSASHLPKEDRRTLARRLHRLGQWTEAMSGLDWIHDPSSEVYRHYMLACKLDDTWFTGSYSLATAAMAIFETRQYDKTDSVALNSYVVPAVRGLFQAVRAEQSPEKMIKALLRLVTIWFRYGESDSVLAEVEYQLVSTPIASWLSAIPQLIARLGTKHRDLQGVLVGLLESVASAYPHAIIWPLMTASQTINQEHQEAAKVIMNHISTMRDGATLVSQAETVGKELIRVSISWMEKWRNIIDKALPRTDLMEIPWHEVPEMWRKDYEELAHPETPDEEAFIQRFGRSIELVYKTLVRYRSTRSVGYINTAYTEIYKLFGDLDAGIAQQYKIPNPKLSMQNTAPKLLMLKDCILTVPGQYDPQVKLDDQAFIDSFPSTVSILSSKMIPRKLTVTSWRAQRDDFTSYTFLLKGNEDLRGDERIMQLFNLINTLLNHSSEAFSRNLHLLPYEVIPLSPSAGLVSWVSNTQQLQSMILSNREKNKKMTLGDKELASMLGYDPATFNSKTHNPPLDLTTEMQKHVQLPVEVKAERLKAAWSHSDQNEIKETLWQKSPSAEIWIKRRTNFARTLGVGSMVGHVIGLGDRHGSNILVDQLTWTALHIDFGDLFCIAQERSYLPEKVPFRLTRMMTNAMEMASNKGKHCPGSRGSYKQASIVSMSVLRENRGSLLAMLEAFLYDPLLSWTSEAEPSTSVKEQGSKQDSKTSNSLAQPHLSKQPAQSVAPAMPYQQGQGRSDPSQRTESSLVDEAGQDSWIAKIAVGGMTNAKALKVLAVIEKKLAGLEMGEEQAMSIKQQVQYLIEEATEPKNLAQGYVLGWMPHW